MNPPASAVASRILGEGHGCFLLPTTPAQTVPQLRDGYAHKIITALDLTAAGISTVIWAIGYSFDFSFVKLPVVDSDGYPIQKRGVTNYDGLYFLGLPWLHSRRSGILFGVGDDARYIAQHIAARSIPAGLLSEVWEALGARE